METLLFLIAFPLCVASVLIVVKSEALRRAIVWGAAIITAIASLACAVQFLGAGATFFEIESEFVDLLCLGVGLVVGAIVIAFALRYRKVLAGILGVIQVSGTLAFDAVFSRDVSFTGGLYVDGLSLLMVLIIGVIGSGICIYALGYMEDFQAHENGEPDRRPLFFALMFIFLSAMFVIVVSDNMSWMFSGWEVTTVCSFLLIGYTRTDEAIRNAFRQIVFNLIGGIAFLSALWYCACYLDTLSFSRFLSLGLSDFSVAMPVCCLAIAGMTKAAQMPFHTWLLGAMVAPTPTSALLHSSTMVKAGVFLLIKLAPLFAVCPIPQTMVIFVGMLTFLFCSCLGISQTNAKRVLAYSTIANLGLITACAGVGTPEAVWAACFLVLFHAAAKSLLFLCVGTAEHHIGSRDIEDMDLLFQRMPRLARLMMLGIMVMFVAPFGMLLSKWAALLSFVDTGSVMVILLLAFGSAATFMFWAKWLGKLAGIAGEPENVERSVHRSEWVALNLMTIIGVGCCLGFPLVSDFVIEPYLQGVYGFASQGLSDVNLWLAAATTMAVLFVIFGGRSSAGSRQVDVYLAGASLDDGGRVFRGSMGEPVVATTRNMYLPRVFGERLLTPVGELVCGALMVCCVMVACLPSLLVL